MEMETEIQKKCFVCKETMVSTSPPVCVACRQKDADNLLKAQTFHKEHPDAGLAEIAEGTSIPYRTVNWYFNNGKFGYNQNNLNNRLNKDNKGISITDTLYSDYIWIEISGKIDSANALTLQRYIDRLLEDGWTDFIIDMNSVTFFSSTGIRVIMSAYKKLYEIDGSIKIASPSSNVKNVLGMVALDTMLL